MRWKRDIMSAQDIGGQFYTCPMHKNVCQIGPGKCPSCGMALLPEGTRFAMIKHMMSGPMPFVMGAVMIALMAAAMMTWK